MGEVLGIGVTHYPPLGGRDEDMTWVLEKTLEDPGIPDEVKAVEAWPEPMRDEWGDDKGLTGALEHRRRLLDGMRRARKTLDEFAPDVIVIWGDDQYENFREDIIPPFCIAAYGDRDVQPWDHAKRPNVWNEPPDHTVTVRGSREIGKQLAAGLIDSGFDMPYAYEPLHHPGLAHAFMNTILFLDYDRNGFPYPVLPFQVNCYGSRVISYRGTLSRFADRGRPPDPPSPTPDRCLALGAATARVLAQSDLRVALIASASWSHAFLTDKTWRIHPDVISDRALYESLRSGDYAAWSGVPRSELVSSGQQEMLNWFCLVGAMEELGRAPSWTDYVETYVFNSDKVFATFEP